MDTQIINKIELYEKWQGGGGEIDVPCTACRTDNTNITNVRVAVRELKLEL